MGKSARAGVYGGDRGPWGKKGPSSREALVALACLERLYSHREQEAKDDGHDDEPAAACLASGARKCYEHPCKSVPSLASRCLEANSLGQLDTKRMRHGTIQRKTQERSSCRSIDWTRK